MQKSYVRVRQYLVHGNAPLTLHTVTALLLRGLIYLLNMLRQRDCLWSFLIALGLLLATQLSIEAMPGLLGMSLFDAAKCLTQQGGSLEAGRPWRRTKQARVVVITVWTHYPEMMAMHVSSLRRYLQHELEYLAVGNSNVDAVNQATERMARTLSVSYYHHFHSDAIPSQSHAGALNGALTYLLQPHANGGGPEDPNDSSNGSDCPPPSQDLGNAPLLQPSDMLLLLDSDMYIVAPLDFYQELGSSHLLTAVQWRQGSSRRVHYMWPNFSLFHFGHLPRARALELFRELDFSCHCRTDGAVMDSGACTAPFLDKYGEEMGVVDFVRSCSVSDEHIDQAVCAFLANENSIERAPQCTTSYTLENEALAANPTCEHITIPAALDPWQPGELIKLPNATRWTQSRRSCHGHGKIYHLGSAGSNWRGCPEGFLEGQRQRLFIFLASR